MSEPTSITAVLFKLIGKFIPGLAGGVIAVLTMKFDKDIKFTQKIFPASVALIVGVLVSHFGSGAINEIFPMSEITLDAVKLVLGIFGLTLVNNISSEIKPWFDAIRKKFFGA